MFEEALASAIKVALASENVEESRSLECALAILSEAVYDSYGSRRLFALESASNELVQYDLIKAVLAIAGVLGAIVPLTVSPIGIAAPMGIASILAALGALGAFQGLTQPLPRTCALVIRCLLSSKTMSYENLKAEFYSIYDGSNEFAELEFKQALERLEQLRSIKRREDNVRLVERVIVRT